MSRVAKMIGLIEGAYSDHEFLRAEGLDDAIIGVDREMRLCYSTSMVIKILMKRDKITWEEAEEFFEFNIAGAYVGEQTPVFIDDNF